MNQTVEPGKTLLIDGPASVSVVSGKAEVFGSIVGSSNKIVIRESKRLPFVVCETASFGISLGENAAVEVVPGNTVPPSWTKACEELLKVEHRPITTMVLGAVDSGKTSFATYLINKLLGMKLQGAILDGDLGQSDIGPPSTLAYAHLTKPITDLFDLRAKNAIFVGITSPSSAVDKVIDSLCKLKEEVLTCNPSFIVINTDGWVDGEEALNYKMRLVSKLKPDMVFCIQQKDEMTPLLNNIGNLEKIVVDSPLAIKQRSMEKRRNLRELGYIKYMRNAKMQSLPLGWLKIEGNEVLGLKKTPPTARRAQRIYELLGMKPLHYAELEDRVSIVIGRTRWIHEDRVRKIEEFAKKKVAVIRKGEEEGLLAGFHDADRKFLGIGILQEVDYNRRTARILTPVSKEIAIITLGKIKLDKNMKEIPAFPEETEMPTTNSGILPQ
jgi:polynucleotide 5'-hydroxyl-kinase GRC3/NOL9